MHDIIISEKQAWLNYFDRAAALESVSAHIASLPSNRTDEKYTLKVYGAGLQYFFNWIGDELPTPDKLRGYIAHLIDKDLKSTTISSKYLAPVRLYLKRLADQLIPGLKGDTRGDVEDWREQIRQAAALPTPKPQTSTNVAPLWDTRFTRLTLPQVNAVLRQIDRSTLAGLRDYGLLHISISTGLRLAEIARICPASISAIGDAYLITVRGKRSNSDPVPISADAYADLVTYIDAFNAPLPADDPRRIVGDIPVWQPLHANKYHFAIGHKNPCKGLAHSTIRDLIAKHTGILGEAFTCAPHDLRRTAAAIAYDSGMPLTDIQSLLRHKDASVTLHYVGTKPDFHKRSLSTYVNFG
jgi:integrase